MYGHEEEKNHKLKRLFSRLSQKLSAVPDNCSALSQRCPGQWPAWLSAVRTALTLGCTGQCWVKGKCKYPFFAWKGGHAFTIDLSKQLGPRNFVTAYLMNTCCIHIPKSQTSAIAPALMFLCGISAYFLSRRVDIDSVVWKRASNLEKGYVSHNFLTKGKNQ